MSARSASSRTPSPGAAVTGAITGFANADGGLVILGVTDYGSLAGGPGEVEDVQEKLDTLLHTGLSAPVPAALGHHAESGVALQPPAVVGSARTES